MHYNEKERKQRILFFTNVNFLLHNKILWNRATYATHAKILNHAIFLTHA